MYIILALLIVLGFVLQSLFIKSELEEKMVRAVVLKGSAAAFFVAIGSYLSSLFPSRFATLVLIGLILGMAGDILLNLRYVVKKGQLVFALGILAFLSGHFLYIAALFHLGGKGIILYSLILTALFSVARIPPLMRSITAPSKGLKIFGYVYLVVVIMMFSVAASLILKGIISLRTATFTLGALSFVISDFIMIYYNFGNKLPKLRVINLLTYYLGQILIALTIMMK